MANFVKMVWKAARSLNVGVLTSVNLDTGNTIESYITDYLVGVALKRGQTKVGF